VLAAQGRRVTGSGPDTVALMGIQDATTDVLAKVMNRSHRLIWKVSGGRLLSSPFGMPAVELHTIGRKSGQRRTVILTTPVHDASRVVLIASKGGDDRHPDWYRNLAANPDVEITIDGTTAPYRARTASAEEKAVLWPEVVNAYKGYDGYQRKTDREIPVVICEPR
jgi:deazaflavin-dependent oxidoreductase (nitroreductase family)